MSQPKRFTSRRERRLWMWWALVVALIYASLGLAGELAEELDRRQLTDAVFAWGFLMLLVAVAVIGVLQSPSWLEVAIGFGVGAVFVMVASRVAIPEERTHLFEYALVGALSVLALQERRANSGSPTRPAVTAIGLTAALGAIDEAIQWVLPNRVFDMRDIVFNVVSGVMGVTTVLVLQWARRRARPATRNR